MLDTIKKNQQKLLSIHNTLSYDSFRDLCNCVVIILNYIFRYVNVLIVQCHPMKIVLISKYMYILRLTADVIFSSPVANTFLNVLVLNIAEKLLAGR
jgi:hypothetical protein